MPCWLDQLCFWHCREVKREQKARSLPATLEPAQSGNERQTTRQRPASSKAESAATPSITSRELRALVRGQSGFANLDTPLLESTGTKKRRQVFVLNPLVIMCVIYV